MLGKRAGYELPVGDPLGMEHPVTVEEAVYVVAGTGHQLLHYPGPAGNTCHVVEVSVDVVSGHQGCNADRPESSDRLDNAGAR